MSQLSPKPALSLEIKDFQERIRAFQEQPLTPTHHPARALRSVRTVSDLRRTHIDRDLQNHPT